MPYLPHLRATTHFSLGPYQAPTEEATCTLNFTNSAVGLNAEGRQNAANDMFADWAAWMSTSRVSSHVVLDGLKLYSIGADGRIDQDPIEAVGGDVQGGITTNLHPWQCSMVMTLRAGQRGKGRFGRIYLPPQGYAMNNDGTVDNGHVTEMFAATKTLLTNLSNTVGPDLGFGLVVAGKTGTGTLREVTQVSMGRVSDTQRRRRRNLEEAYITESFDA